jgi:hypothetical protein
VNFPIYSHNSLHPSTWSRCHDCLRTLLLTGTHSHPYTHPPLRCKLNSKLLQFPHLLFSQVSDPIRLQCANVSWTLHSRRRSRSPFTHHDNRRRLPLTSLQTVCNITIRSSVYIPLKRKKALRLPYPPQIVSPLPTPLQTLPLDLMYRHFLTPIQFIPAHVLHKGHHLHHQPIHR